MIETLRPIAFMFATITVGCIAVLAVLAVILILTIVIDEVLTVISWHRRS